MRCEGRFRLAFLSWKSLSSTDSKAVFYWAFGGIKPPLVVPYVAFGESKFEDARVWFMFMPLRELFLSYMTSLTASVENLKA